MPQRSIIIRLMIAVAAIIVIIAAVIFVRPHGGTAESPQQLTLVTPREWGTVASRNQRFRWQREMYAKAYQFSVYEVNRSLLWSALVRDTSVVIPGSVSLQQGQTYLWRVEAIMPDETTVHSDLWAFTFSE